MMSDRPRLLEATVPQPFGASAVTAHDDLPAAVLWDMDGTIVDTEPCWAEAEDAMMGEFGVPWSAAEGLALIGMPLPEAAELFRSRGVPLAADQIIERLLGHVVLRVRSGAVTWRPGALELLEALRLAGVPNALVTMSYTPLSDAIIELLPEGTFATVVTGDVVEQGKPHPEPYLTAAAALGVAPGEAVAIEDSLPGVTSAQSAGVPVIAVQHLIPLPEAPGRLVTDTLIGITPFDLARLVREIKRRDESGR